MTITPEEFVEKWGQVTLKETASAQSHFEDVCRLVGHELPADLDPHGEFFTYEKGVEKVGGGQGFADVWYDKHFAIEYKGKSKYPDLTAAYQQLLRYRENLNNPPLLVVCDIEHWEIHTNWPGMAKEVYQFKNEDITNPRWFGRLRDMFHAPDRLNPQRNKEDVTKNAAEVFHDIAANMRAWEAEADRIAHFLTKLVFCLFAEDVSLLPTGPRGDMGIFSEIVEQTRTSPSKFVRYMHDLFEAMADGGELLFAKIPYFNGQLFEDVAVEELPFEALNELERAARMNWGSVEPSIFGTLFERSLDPSKRAQLGAHYTSRDDILLIVEPVLMQPLRREWEAVQEKAAPIRKKFEAAKTTRDKKSAGDELIKLRDGMLEQLRTVKVLDPACGSGNFLYVALGLLLDLEKAVINNDLFAGVGDEKPQPQVHPRQLYGIEINPIAHALASIVVWIGYIQWRQQNGYFDFKEPILEYLEANIQCKDAILAFDEKGNTVEPEWPVVDVIVGNPPFLGGSLVRGELGVEYYENLTGFYRDRIPGFSDLVCYWFECARTQIESSNAKRAGLLATNSIRGGANREVLKRIKATGNIFMAWSDREWILDGASVRVSIVGFDIGSEMQKALDGVEVNAIYSDLTGDIDLTIAKPLYENGTICFRSDEKGGPFDISADLAKSLLNQSNSSGLANSDVVRPYLNAMDLLRNPRNMWIIDFGVNTPENDAMKYEAPFDYVKRVVQPVRSGSNNRREREFWWLHRRPAPDMRNAMKILNRFIATPAVGKHRLFIWLDSTVLPDHQLYVVAREDDYFFGVLHSVIHEVWSLRMGTWLGKGNDPRYTPTTTFETFPFPWSPGQEPVGDAKYEAIAAAAKELDEERSAWLNGQAPPSNSSQAWGENRPVSAKGLKDRTLTNLYNALNVFREKETIKIKASAGDFAPRLDVLHQALDAAVCAAYGWPVEVLKDEEEILKRLLALNLERAGEIKRPP